MSNLILAGILLVLCLQGVLLFIIFAKSIAVLREFIGFISPPDPDKPSPAALVWANMARSLAQEFKFTLMGMMSVQAKAEKRLEGEIVNATLAQQNPLLAVALQVFPGLKKMLAKNPALVEIAIQKAAQIGGNHSQGNLDDYASKLSKYA